MAAPHIFPALRGRNLLGQDVTLPDAFEGARNVVMVAFQREQQDLVDSWVPTLAAAAASDPELRFYEIPVIGSLFAPARRFIDGGMATAIGDREVLARTITVYGPVNAVTKPLGIRDRSTITVFLLDRDSRIEWSSSGGWSADSEADLRRHLNAMEGPRA
jgi:hypothetical protein